MSFGRCDCELGNGAGICEALLATVDEVVVKVLFWMPLRVQDTLDIHLRL